MAHATHGVLGAGEAPWALAMVYLSRIIDGSTAGNISLAQAYISDNTQPKDRAKSFALIGIAFGVGFLFGPALAGYLAGPTTNPHLTRPIYLAAAMSAMSILCTALLVRGGAPVHTPSADDAGPGGKRLGIFNWSQYLQYFKRPALRAMLLQFFCYMLCFTLFTSGFALFAERRFTWKGHPFGPREIGFVFGYAGFLGIILQGGLVGRLVARFGEKRLIIAGFATLVVGYCLLGATWTIALLVVTTTVNSFGNGVLRPALTSLITQIAARHEQGVVLGLMQSLTSVAQIVSPTIAGMLIDRHWLGPWCLTASVFSAVGLALSMRSGAARGKAEVGRADESVEEPVASASSARAANVSE
jgi:MFS family permease